MFAEIALPLALVLIMGSLGLTLVPGDFKRVVTAPKGVGIGLVNLLLVSPLLAFAIGEIYGLAAVLAVGVVLLGASPGGTTANMLTHLARGDVALSVTMTAVSSVASVITVPLFLSLAADYFGAQDISDQISMPGIAARVFLITIVPLSIGMLIRARKTAWTLRWMGTVRKAALIAFVLVVAGAVASEIDLLREAFAEIAIAVITLNVAAMTISFLVARAARLDGRQSTAIAMELGVHNTTVALAVATAVGDDLAGPAAVYGLFMFVTAGLFARFMSRRNAADAAVAGDAHVVVPGTPDVVWRAVATGDGLSAWLAPTRLEGGEVVTEFGALGAARARVVAEEPPRRFAFAEEGWLEGAPPLQTELHVEPAGEGRCRVRVVERLLGAPDDRQRIALQEAEASWHPHLAALRLHLEHHAGEPAHRVDLTRPVGDRPWREAVEALGLPGEVVHEGARELVLRLDGEAPGHAVVVVDDTPDGDVLSLGASLYGPAAREAGERLRAAWSPVAA